MASLSRVTPDRSLIAATQRDVRPESSPLPNKNFISGVVAITLAAVVVGLVVGGSLALFGRVSVLTASLAGSASATGIVTLLAIYILFNKRSTSSSLKHTLLAPALSIPPIYGFKRISHIGKSKQSCYHRPWARCKAEVPPEEGYSPFMRAYDHAKISILCFLNIRELARCSQLNGEFYKFGSLIPQGSGGRPVKDSLKLSRAFSPHFALLWKPAIMREVAVGKSAWKEYHLVDIEEEPCPDKFFHQLFQLDLSTEGAFFIQTSLLLYKPETFRGPQDEQEQLLNTQSYGKLLTRQFPKTLLPKLTPPKKSGFLRLLRGQKTYRNAVGTSRWSLVKVDRTLDLHKDMEKAIAYNNQICREMGYSHLLPTIIALSMRFFRTGQCFSGKVCCGHEWTSSGTEALIVSFSAKNGPEYFTDSYWPYFLPCWVL